MNLKLYSAMAAMLMGVTALAQQEPAKTTVTADGGWVFNAEILNDGVSISDIQTVGSGVCDLSTAVISPATDKKIFNIRPRTFREQTALTGIKFPASLRSFFPLEAAVFFTTDIDGADSSTLNGGIPNGENRYRSGLTEVGGSAFDINITVTFNGWDDIQADARRTKFLSYWGNALLTATAQNSDDGREFNATPTKNWIHDNNMWQVYLASGGELKFVCNKGEVVLVQNVFSTCTGKLTINLNYDPANTAASLSYTVNNGAQEFKGSQAGVVINAFSALATNVRSDVHLTADVSEPEGAATAEVDNPFRGCVNLQYFEVEEGNPLFTVGPNGALRKKDDSTGLQLVKAYPYGKLFNKYVRFFACDENGQATAACITSNITVNADNSATGRNIGAGLGKSANSLFMFVHGDSTEAYIKDINAAAIADGPFWLGSKGASANLECVANNIKNPYAGKYGMSVVPGRELVTFNMTVADRAWYLQIVKNGDTYNTQFTKDRAQATEFHVEFATEIDVPVSAGYASACLPVAVNHGDDAILATVASVTNNEVKLSELKGTIAPNVPFIIKAANTSAETVTLTIADETTPATLAGEAAAPSFLKGYTCAVTAGLTQTDTYALSGDSFTQTSTMGSNAAFIAKPADVNWDSALTINSEVSTAITEIETSAPATRAIFDLQGRRLAEPVRGINIINGRKILVR